MLKPLRNLLIIAPLITSALTATAQQQQATEDVKPRTKLESFIAKDGVVLIKGTSEIGKMGGMSSSLSVESKEFTDAATGKKEYGILVEVVKSMGSAIGSRESRSYIDYDEIESLVSGLDYIAKLDNSVTKLADFEANYNTKGSLKLSVFSGGANLGSLFGNPDKKTLYFAVESGTIGSVTSFFKYESAKQFRELIVKAKEKIDSIK